MVGPHGKGSVPRVVLWERLKFQEVGGTQVMGMQCHESFPDAVTRTSLKCLKAMGLPGPGLEPLKP